MADHSIFAPSSAATWRYCPGSMMLRALYPEPEDSPASMEGTAAHWVCAEILAERHVDVGSVAPNGVMITAEMMDGAEMYCADISYVTRVVPHVEERVSCARIHPDCWGTPDAWGWDAERGVLFLWDYKFGHGYVGVFENQQLICYASGILDALGVSDLGVRIVFRIVQPRSYSADGPIREWSVLASDLRAHWNLLAGAASAAKSDSAPCKPGPYCKYCSARHVCPALQRTALANCDLSAMAVPLELSAPDLGLELSLLSRAAKLLDARITGLHEAALSLARAGTLVPGWKVTQGMGRETWSVPIGEIVALGDALGVPLSKPGVVTPKQAIKAGVPPDVVAAYSYIPTGEMKLVPDDGAAARRVFSTNSQE